MAIDKGVQVVYEICVVLLVMALPAIGAAPAVQVSNLSCEYRTNPLGIDSLRPRLGWNIESSQRGEMQTAYQVRAASSQKLLDTEKPDLWDSGKVTSDQCVGVIYAGKALQSSRKCFWKVRAWDVNGKPSSWSAPGVWTAGLQPSDWKAEWIRCSKQTENEGRTSPWLRKSFELKIKPTQALAYVNAAGYFELYVNGKKAGTDVLSPAVSNQGTRSRYIAFDIAPLLQKGRNVVGLWLGRGWSAKMNPPGPAVQVQCEIADGASRVRIISDTTWKGAPSPYAMAGGWDWNNYGGERYDARLENADWCSPDFDDSAWPGAVVFSAPEMQVEAQKCPVNRVGKRIPAVSVTDIGDGRYEIDFGTNLAGWMRLKMPAMDSGRKVTMYYADRRQEKDPVAGEGGSSRAFPRLGKTTHYQTFNQFDEFISAGRPGEEFCSKFNYHGFRYVVIEGLPAKPSAADAEALLVESDLPITGSFECSNELFNRIHGMNVWTIRCLNLGGYLVDCPHRERLGYGDGQVSIESCVMNFSMPAFYEKWVQDWADAQLPSGDIPHTAPNYGGGGGPGWGGTPAAATWRSYLYYGDRKILEDNYQVCRRYVDYLETKCPNGIMRTYGGVWDFIGDWLPPTRGMDTSNTFATPAANEVFNNCYRVYLWEELEKSAKALGYEDEAKRASDKLAEIRPLIHKTFYSPEAHIYAVNEQPFQLMPLMTGATPDSERASVMKTLETNIVDNCKGHFDTGMLGTYFMIQFLQSIDRNDLLFTMMNQTSYPGWGWMLEQGATACTEQWNGFWSNIHSCFTSADSWFYQGVAGIRPDERAPGFKRIVIKPGVVGDLTFAKARVQSVYGAIESSWKLDAGKLSLAVTIPGNTTATVYVPTKDAARVTESGKLAAKSAGVRFLRTENGCAVYEVKSGHYRFEAPR